MSHVYRRKRARDGVLPSSSSDDGDDDDDDGPTLMGIDMPRRQFASWVNYYLTHMTSDGEAMTTCGWCGCRPITK